MQQTNCADKYTSNHAPSTIYDDVLCNRYLKCRTIAFGSCHRIVEDKNNNTGMYFTSILSFFLNSLLNKMGDVFGQVNNFATTLQQRANVS